MNFHIFVIGPLAYSHCHGVELEWEDISRTEPYCIKVAIKLKAIVLDKEKFLLKEKKLVHHLD